MKLYKKRKLYSVILFYLYMVALCYFLFFAEFFGRVDTGREYYYNLQLFKEIYRFYHYRHILGMKAFLLNVVGNVVVFFPFGYFLPMMTKRCKNFLFVTILTATTSLCIESIQLVCKVGSFDVDDILLNTLGGMIGYLIYRVHQLWFRRQIKRKGMGNNERYKSEKN